MDFLQASLLSFNDIRNSLLERSQSFGLRTAEQQTGAQAADRAINQMRQKLLSGQQEYLKQTDISVGGYLNQLEQSVASLMETLHMSPLIDNRRQVPADNEQRLAQLKTLLASIGQQVVSLNAAPANRFYPKVEVTTPGMEGETMTVNIGGKISRVTANTPPLTEAALTGNAAELESLLRKLLNDVADARAVLEPLVASIGNDRRYFPSMADFDRIAAAYLAEGERGWAETNRGAARELFRQPHAAEDDKLFSDIAAYAAAHPPTDGNFAADALDVIRLGDMAVQMGSAQEAALLPQDALLLRRAPSLRAVLPLTWDLRQIGGIVLDASESGVTEPVRQTVDRLIAHMLLHFPPGRLNLCLIDCKDRCNFARFARLAQANQALLCDGIVRAEGRVEETLANMLSLVHRTQDRLYMGERTDDFFTYNQKALGNPLAATLVVCVGFPGALRDGAVNDLQQLFRAGAQVGVYTLLVCDGKAFRDMSMRDVTLDLWLSQLKGQALMFRVHGEGLLLGMTPLANACRLAATPDIGQCVQMLEKGFGQNRGKSIPLSEMFTASDRFAQKGTPAEELLEIPIGVSGNQIVSLPLDTTGRGSPYAVAIGSPGMGKSSLLHTIILSACYRYSPLELNLYLVDFKGGVEFKYYEAGGDRRLQLPHIRLVGLSSDAQDGMAILQNLYEQMLEREHAFTADGADSLLAYNRIRQAQGKPGLPRLFMIVDEVQELLQGSDRLTQDAVDLIGRILKKGRALGIGVMLVTQNLPSTPGLQQQIISSIGNRISLRLNNPENAEAIGIDSRLVRQLDATLTGIGVLRVGNASAEFRTAFAGEREERGAYRERILGRWNGAAVPDLYVIGQPGKPDPIAPGTLYGVALSRGLNRQRFADTVHISLGINYVSGKQVPLWLYFVQANANVWISGTDAGLTRDILSHAVFSVLLGTRRGARPLYFANAEYRDASEPDDLIFLIPQALPQRVLDITAVQRFRDTVVELFRLRRARARDMSGTSAQPEPVFLCVNKLQAYDELFSSTESIPAEERPVPQAQPRAENQTLADLFAAGDPFAGRAAGGARENLTFAAMFVELLKRGPDVGIHLLFTLATPSAIPAIRGFQESVAYKVITRGGVDASMDYTRGITWNREDMAVLINADKMQKVIPYQYTPLDDSEWCGRLIRALQEESRG